MDGFGRGRLDSTKLGGIRVRVWGKNYGLGLDWGRGLRLGFGNLEDLDD